LKIGSQISIFGILLSKWSWISDFGATFTVYFEMKKSKSEIGEIHQVERFSHICHSETLAEESICITFSGSFAFAQDDKTPTFLNFAIKNPQVFCM
jgi:hypothetical protein